MPDTKLDVRDTNTPRQGQTDQYFHHGLMLHMRDIHDWPR